MSKKIFPGVKELGMKTEHIFQIDDKELNVSSRFAVNEYHGEPRRTLAEAESLVVIMERQLAFVREWRDKFRFQYGQGDDRTNLPESDRPGIPGGGAK